MEELSTWTNLFMANAMIQNHYLDICRLAQNQPQPISPAFWALLLSLKPFVLNRHWVRWLVWLDWQLSIWWLGQAFPTPVHSIRYTSGKSHSKRLASLRVTPQSLANSCTRGNIDVSWVFPYLSFAISQHSTHRHKEAINPSTSHHGATGSKSKSLVRLVLKRCNRIGKNWTSIGVSL